MTESELRDHAQDLLTAIVQDMGTEQTPAEQTRKFKSLRAAHAMAASGRLSRPTFFKCRSKYGRATVSDVKRLRELEAENAQLKRMYADVALENAAIKDVLHRKL